MQKYFRQLFLMLRAGGLLEWRVPGVSTACAGLKVWQLFMTTGTGVKVLDNPMYVKADGRTSILRTEWGL